MTTRRRSSAGRCQRSTARVRHTSTSSSTSSSSGSGSSSSRHVNHLQSRHVTLAHVQLEAITDLKPPANTVLPPSQYNESDSCSSGRVCLLNIFVQKFLDPDSESLRSWSLCHSPPLRQVSSKSVYAVMQTANNFFSLRAIS